MGDSAEWINVLNRLNGKIYLIAGNHDIKDLRQNYTKYFEQITIQMHIEVDKQKIYLSHCPFLCYGGVYRDTCNFSDMYIPAGITPEGMFRG